MQNHFQDQNKRLSDFQKEVVVVCPKCEKKALATVDYDTRTAKLFCTHCGYHKQETTEIMVLGMKARKIEHAASYFDAEPWFIYPFKNEIFWAYNEAHLEYLENYISAKLREHKDRSHFTLLEKLPKFYHEAKNREPLLKIIEKLKKK